MAFAFVYRTPATPPPDVSASVAALTATAVPSPTEVAALPFRPYERGLSALHDDTTRLARFVGSQLDVLPGE